MQNKTKHVPLMMEFPINPETGPFLVSSSRSVLWVLPKRPIIRAAVRPMTDLGEFFLEVVNEVRDMGRESEWGNVHPWTSEGLLGALAHVRSYEITDVEILAGGSDPDAVVWGDLPQPVLLEDEHLTLCGVPLEVVPWLPPTMLVVVPQDRDYLGFVLLLRDKGLAVVHNASRGMAIVISG
jgi:hypothetical protein